MLTISKKAYIELIEQDLAYLNEHCKYGAPELDHIKLIICKSIDWLYSDELKHDTRERAVKAFRHAIYEEFPDATYNSLLEDFLNTFDNEQ